LDFHGGRPSSIVSIISAAKAKAAADRRVLEQASITHLTTYEYHMLGESGENHRWESG
jgi:hypothetical protein